MPVSAMTSRWTRRSQPTSAGMASAWRLMSTRNPALKQARGGGDAGERGSVRGKPETAKAERKTEENRSAAA